MLCWRCAGELFVAVIAVLTISSRVSEENIACEEFASTARSLRFMPIGAASAALRCWLADLPDALLALILSKLTFEEADSGACTQLGSACIVCKHLSQLPVDAYLPDMLRGLSDEQRRSMVVENYCARATRWPMRWLPILTRTFSLNGRIPRAGHCTPLHIAVRSGNQPTVEALIALGADVRIPDAVGRSPLWTNCESGTRRLAEVLIEAGADLNAACRMDRSSPLLLAVYHRQDAIAYALIAAGADVNAPDYTPDERHKARTPLWYAFEKEHDKPGGQALIDALSAADANLEAETPVESDGESEEEDV